MPKLELGCRVELTGKNLQGKIAFIGQTHFETGTWVGIILDEPKGKNNGVVKNRQGVSKTYFECEENHGIFVRQSHLTLIDETGARFDMSASTESLVPKSSVKSRISSSRQSLSGSSRLSLIAPKNKDDTFTSPVSRTSSQSSLVGTSRTPSQSSIVLPSRTSSQSSMPAPSRTLSQTSLAGMDSTPKRSSFVERTPSNEKTSRMSKLISPKVKSAVKTPMTKSLTSLKDVSNSETEFVEALKPHYTPGSSVAPSTTTPTQRPSSSMADAVEIQNLKDQVQDYTEKLDVVKTRLKEKSHDIDMMKLQLDQAAEFKIKIMESHSALKKELEKVKMEKQDALEGKDEYNEMAETLEMATLDKEMAEVKAETLQLELDQAKERIEELTVDLELLKAEFEKGNESEEGGDGANSFKVKQLEQQNLRLRDTLVKLRDLSAHEKHQTQNLQREIEEKTKQCNDLQKSNEKLTARVEELASQVNDLHEQVDAALGAEELVELLGQQKLNLEDKVVELEEAVTDLEAIQDINDQLQEDSRELEMQLREELDMANANIRECVKEKERALESLADRSLVIVKFRDLVNELREQNQDLQTQLMRESASKDEVRSSIPEMLDFKKMFAETKAHSRAIDLELRRMETQEAQQHIQYLLAYMPDSFLSLGGDYDAILSLLLLPRMIWKSEILMTHVRDKYPDVQEITKETLIKDHSAEQFATRSRLSFYLYSLQTALRQFVHGMNTTTPETLIKIGESYPDMTIQEKVLNGYIEMLKIDQLDENVNTENLERCVAYFKHVYAPLIQDFNPHYEHLLLDNVLVLSAACNTIQTDANIIKCVIQCDGSSNVLKLCDDILVACEVIHQHLKQIKKRADINSIIKVDLSSCIQYAEKLITVLRETAKCAVSQISLGTDDKKINSESIMLVMNNSVEKVFEKEESNNGVTICLKMCISTLAGEIANAAQVILEADLTLPTTDKSKNIPPITERAKQIKSELEETKALRNTIKSKENDILELKMALRSKQEEIGELNVRKELAEKKLSTTIHESEISIEKLQRKLDETQQQLKRKSKEYEETMDHLQADIDSLETEKGELKNKLKNFSKKILIEGINKSASMTATGNDSNKPYQESPFLLNELKLTKMALKHEIDQRAKLENNYCEQLFSQLKPLPVPSEPSDEEKHRVVKLKKLGNELLNDFHKTLTNINVLDVTKRVPGRKLVTDENISAKQVLDHNLQWKQLQKRLDVLQDNYNKEIIKRQHFGCVETEMTTFPTPALKKALEEEEPVLAAEFVIPKPANWTGPTNIRVEMDTKILASLQNQVTNAAQINPHVRYNFAYTTEELLGVN
ncbi:dynactin subunit 1 isoform X3 [Acyrthosiphon pisum]|uniref:Dynactin subunit 1 n=1 Tax=Acyrthosiphon pisum TaxID=7029 RepID=A0A8R2B5S6_ACYPI|nr:dynactin subunit 1 isoform X3 [Acyrthosiphon pisum]|eukprot:XP_008183205.1 PREDICTED: dynactin subunit 1 isoform X3 [Acyrthosiphon pisum]